MDPTVLRILDVNINRLREALRGVEDHARFVHDDAATAEAVKQCRHQLRDLVQHLGADALLASRDIVGDVGRDVKTAGEQRRSSADDVARAACIRAQEAARVLSEYAKTVNGAAANLAEQIRYQVYALEQTVVLRSRLRAKLKAADVYVLITADLCRGDWLDTAAAALRGGAGVLQLREKDLDGGELLRRGRALRELTHEHDALLIINDRPDIARLVDADGVHVGQDDLSVADVRHVAGAGVLVGKSTHTPQQFATALAEEPDYLAVGPMFATATKPQDHIAGPETLRQVRPTTDLPIVAIGGITAESAAQIRQAGADVLAVCQTILAAENPQQAARGLSPAEL